jgi:hypothetical protein
VDSGLLAVVTVVRVYTDTVVTVGSGLLSSSFPVVMHCTAFAHTSVSLVGQLYSAMCVYATQHQLAVLGTSDWTTH